MKLICLNAWGGRVFGPLLDFIKTSAATTDIFCFQEIFTSSGLHKLSNGMRSNLYGEIETALPDFKGAFSAQCDRYDYVSSVNFDLSSGQATFVKNTAEIKKSGEIFTYKNKNEVAKDDKDGDNVFPENMQFVEISYKGSSYIICNVHGIPTWPKVDNPERIRQSEIILDFLKKSSPTKKILCGDFNLSPETLSVGMIEKVLVNVTKNYGIKYTRSPLLLGEGDTVSDYIFVSQNVVVSNLKTLNIEVSDHLPLVLEFI
ncbi:MAG: endonuclease/exonuclease/phosphatase family protein [Candidatus Liptonbacteria bacterium]|nr:endonuclease/exonuclease/phosphatase family protein [Candidatus Liptonbacteria bacterium]